MNHFSSFENRQTKQKDSEIPQALLLSWSSVFTPGTPRTHTRKSGWPSTGRKKKRTAGNGRKQTPNYITDSGKVIASDVNDGNTEKVKYGSATQSLLAVNEGNWEPPFTMLPASQRSGFHSQINAATSCLKETEGLFYRTRATHFSKGP